MKHLSNRITILRIIIAFLIILLLMFPLHLIGLSFQKYLINQKLIVDSRYFLAGILFIFAIITDIIDDRIAVKNKSVTNFGVMLDSIANTILINATLISLAVIGFVNPFVPVIMIIRDSVIQVMRITVSANSESSNLKKLQTVTKFCAMIGITLTLFYNLPFELYNLRVGDFVLALAATLSVVSGIEYYSLNKKLFFTDLEKDDKEVTE